MMLRSSLLFALSATTSATNLFVSSYSGNITSLSLTESNGTVSLESTFFSSDCGPNPSWLTIDASRGLLFCLNEGLTAPNGSLSSFTVNRDGSLNHVKNETTISGPVSGVIYGNPAGRRAIALAHYTGSSVSSYYLDGGGQFHLSESFTYSLSQPGPDAARQDSPHPHEAFTDPTGQYLLVPDLGADLVRVYGIDAETLNLTELAPLEAPAGSGPRHAAFYNPYNVASEGATTFLHLATELAGTIISYSVTYLPNGGGLNFTQVAEVSALWLLTHDRINAPAGVLISPDNRFLIVSNRNSTLFSLPNPDTTNSTQIPADTLTTFELQHDGSLVFVQAWPSGGLYPRQFSINPSGTLIAVGNQLSANVALLSRNPATGLIGEPLARIPVDGNITCVVFDQEGAGSA
jgi:6-phosphogluconolactonase (cycloisomerase 2 family)